MQIILRTPPRKGFSSYEVEEEYSILKKGMWQEKQNYCKGKKIWEKTVDICREVQYGLNDLWGQKKVIQLEALATSLQCQKLTFGYKKNEIKFMFDVDLDFILNCYIFLTLILIQVFLNIFMRHCHLVFSMFQIN